METYKIFVSSPGDVAAEREVVRQVINRLNAWFGDRVDLEPYFWEEKPMLATKGDFQKQIDADADISNQDLLICVLGARLGSRLHPEQYHRHDENKTPYLSGTEYEFEKAMGAHKERVDKELPGKPHLLVYRRKGRPKFEAGTKADLDEGWRQWEALEEFWGRWSKDEKTKTFKVGYERYDPEEDDGAFERKLESHLKHLVLEWLNLQGLRELPNRPHQWWMGEPYLGLATFQYEHEEILFGRTRDRMKVIDQLKERWEKSRCSFVLIFGASGSGKSSLMHAGVVPWLTKPGVIEGVDFCRRAMLLPRKGNGDLIFRLAQALVEKDALPELLSDTTTVEELATMLRDEPKTITPLIKGALSQAADRKRVMFKLREQPVGRLLLAVDQLEEVFTLEYKKEEGAAENEEFTHEDRQRFFRALSALVTSGYGWTVATLRSDFFHRCEEHTELMKLKEENGHHHLEKPNDAEWGQIVRLPAEASGVVFEDDPLLGKLDEVITRDALSREGALPLLEYALKELYERRDEKGVLTHATMKPSVGSPGP